MSPEAEFSIQTVLARVAGRQPLGREDARRTMSLLLEGKATPAQVGALLMGLRLKGETEEEVVGLVEGMRAASVKIRPRRDVVMDLCGTGGDGSGTFNISTTASFVVAGAGVAVAKHGNRSASSRCGSADVLEALGVPVDLSPERTRTAIEEIGLGFMFAPLYHPAMKHVAGPRREMKIRTIFNLLGPLTNPAGVDCQLLGVFDPARRSLLASVLRSLGSRSVWVVHAGDGLDELSLSGQNSVTALRDGNLDELSVSPSDCGLPTAGPDTLGGGDAAENAAITERLLSGEQGPRRDVVVLNAAAGLVVAGVVADMREGAARAAESIDSGAARGVLDGLRRFR